MLLAGIIDVSAFVNQNKGSVLLSVRAPSNSPFTRALPGADIEPEVEIEESTLVAGVPDPGTATMAANRGKVNEIDFCIAPADVSLSRAYSVSESPKSASTETEDSPRLVSLTRYLNNASNRAVRRILLARSWPSAEALNMSLRQVLAAEKQQPQQQEEPVSKPEKEEVDSSGAKCPVPRPILNILVGGSQESKSATPIPRSRTDEEYVADQLEAFREKYGGSPGYAQAEAYLECILSLATSGEESPRVSEVLDAGIYDESYRRILAVLRSVGTIFEEIPGSRKTIASKLVDQDICLSMLDKISIQKGTPQTPLRAIAADKVDAPVQSISVEGGEDIEPETTTKANSETRSEEVPASKKSKFKLNFWKRKKETDVEDTEDDATLAATTESEEETKEVAEEISITRDDLGGVLLSAEEPSITRQLNVLSNIVERALLFGGDQELLVLSETLAADKPAFIQRWYPGTDTQTGDSRLEEETRPGVQYLNSLIQLLRNCYKSGAVTTLEPPLPLIQSYLNAYDRLMATLVELGSGYVRLIGTNDKMPAPRNAQEELGRFAVWESSFRKSTPDVSSYPEELEGAWKVLDEIGGETIGSSTVVFKPNGDVEVAPPLRGLRWRLDPGPTHLDTCTFQVANEDGTILQYRGFTDRGARLESRFSKRPIRVRGSVMFQMRDGEAVLMGDDYWKDMLPVNYKTGTTKFVMKKEGKSEQ